MQFRCWVAEIVILRRFKHLPPNFWREPKFKWIFMGEVKAATKFIKDYGQAAVELVVTNNKDLTTLSSYGDMEVLLQAEEARQKRLAAPKDTEPCRPILPTELKDLRDFKTTAKTGLFERLNNLDVKDN
jgi:hypothetical protein